MISRDVFVTYTHEALRQLYAPSQLIQNPLVYLCGLSERPDAFVALQDIIIEAVEALNPDVDGNRHPSKEAFALLYHRYVQQLSQKAVAEQLGMSVRHLRRREYTAIEILASHLWSCVDPELAETYQADRENQDDVDQVDSSLGEELAWLQQLSSISATADMAEILTSVVDFTKNLAQQYDVAIRTQMDQKMPMTAVHPVALDQILVNLLTGGIHQLATGHIVISVETLAREITLYIQGVSVRRDVNLDVDEIQAPLDTARQLAQLCDIPLKVKIDQGSFFAEIHLPRTQEISVLVVDDNADTLQLLRRYVATTPYRLIVTQNPFDVYDLATQSSVLAIILDVMMPQIDGWRLLSQLRQRPETSHIPIVVCTILPQRELALSLGAAGFLQKPVSREAFLTMLNRLLATQEPKPA